MPPRNRRPTTPGTILLKHYLGPRGISINKFAAATELSRKHISNIVNDHAALSPATALKFGAVLETSAELWINAQRAVDVWDARQALKKWKPAAVYAGDEAIA